MAKIKKRYSGCIMSIFGIRANTRSIELLSGLAGVLFSVIYIINDTWLFAYSDKLPLSYLNNLMLWVFMLIISVMQLKTLGKDSLESNIGSVLLLRLTGLIWLILAVAYGVDYPPINVSLATKLVLSFMCFFASFALAYRNKAEQLIRKADGRV